MMDFRNQNASLLTTRVRKREGFGKQEIAKIIKEQKNVEVKKV